MCACVTELGETRVWFSHGWGGLGWIAWKFMIWGKISIMATFLKVKNKGSTLSVWNGELYGALVGMEACICNSSESHIFPRGLHAQAIPDSCAQSQWMNSSRTPHSFLLETHASSVRLPSEEGHFPELWPVVPLRWLASETFCVLPFTGSLLQLSLLPHSLGSGFPGASWWCQLVGLLVVKIDTTVKVLITEGGQRAQHPPF